MRIITSHCADLPDSARPWKQPGMEGPCDRMQPANEAAGRGIQQLVTDAEDAPLDSSRKVRPSALFHDLLQRYPVARSAPRGQNDAGLSGGYTVWRDRFA